MPTDLTVILEHRPGELARLLSDALQTCPARQLIDTGALADHLFATFEGAFILARSANEPRHMRAQLTVLRQLLESLLREGPTRS